MRVVFVLLNVSNNVYVYGTWDIYGIVDYKFTKV